VHSQAAAAPLAVPPRNTGLRTKLRAQHQHHCPQHLRSVEISGRDGLNEHYEQLAVYILGAFFRTEICRAISPAHRRVRDKPRQSTPKRDFRMLFWF
jgi:hypothetical protein